MLFFSVIKNRKIKNKKYAIKNLIFSNCAGVGCLYFDRVDLADGDEDGNSENRSGAEKQGTAENLEGKKRH